MYRTIECHTWDDEWFQELDPIGKLTFLYLLTNIRQTACGAFHITLRTIANDIGCDKAAAAQAIETLSEVGKIAWWDEGIVWVRNFYKYQRANSSDKFRISAAKALCDFPQYVRDIVAIAYPELATPCNKEDTLPIPYTYPTDTEPIGVTRESESDTESKTKDVCVAGATPTPAPPAEETPKKPKPKQTAIADDFAPTPDMVTKAKAKYPLMDIAAASTNWVNAMKANKSKYRYTDWNLAWWNGMAKAEDWGWSRLATGKGKVVAPTVNMSGDCPPNRREFSWATDSEGNWKTLGRNRITGELPWPDLDVTGNDVLESKLWREYDEAHRPMRPANEVRSRGTAA